MTRHPSLIRLRPVEPEDLQLLYDIENSPELWDAEESDAPYSKYALRSYIAAMESVHACGQLRLVAEEAATGRPVGLADLNAYSPRDAHAEVGIAILAEMRGRGYGAAALARLEEIAADRLRVHTLLARVGEGNTLSQRLFLGAGYIRTATLCGWHYTRGAYEDVLLFQKFF